MYTKIPQRQLWGLGRRNPRKDRILQEEVRWRAPECDVRVPASPVPDRAFLSTQQSDPITPRRLGAHNGRLAPYRPLDSTPPGTTGGPSTPTMCAPSVLVVTGWGLIPRTAVPSRIRKSRS